MEGKCVVFLFLLAVFFHLSNSAAQPGRNPGRQTRARTVDPNYVYKRLRALEKKYEQSQQKLTKLLSRLDEAKGLFSDDPLCPNARGFFHAEAFKKCYHLEPQDVLQNWTEAESTCQSLNPRAHIVAVESAAEQQFLKAKWKNERGIASVSRFWTSGRLNKSGMWQWKHSQNNFTYNNWIPTTLHNDQRFRCMAVHSSEAYYWGDVACWAPHMVTCEVRL